MAKKKQAKKQEVKIEQLDTNQANSSLRIIIVVLVILIVAILITALITGEIKIGSSGKGVSYDVSIQTEEILAGQVFDQDADNYLVLFYLFDEEDAEVYSTWLYSYSNKENALEYYTVNMSSDFNNLYVSSENVLDVNSASELKIKAPVLVEIEDDEIVKIWDNKEEIKEYLVNFGK